ncbi:hypothetical protein MPLDJ20_320029 [Mesorhizobium plurifarium]|uniref:Uncharacterized protein n=1 Tax=Mesorhizobium plurifarium TaxID=69974 RepID=A0A090GNQ8_MESPL|nr:hypothetical protein MPLDJ20_320029 [Mesorhizobium plurifarium]
MLHRARNIHSLDFGRSGMISTAADSPPYSGGTVVHQGLRAKSVTHVSGINCNLCVRNGP